MKAILFGLIVLLIAEAAFAQVVLGPRLCSTHVHFSYFRCGESFPSWFRTELWQDVIVNGLSYWTTTVSYVPYETILFTRGVIEFDIRNTISGGPFPVPGLTSFNWSASLNHLVIFQTSAWQGTFLGANLMDMADLSQDGMLTNNDKDERQFIAHLFDDIPIPPQTYSIDVTDVLRHDLFGSDPSPTSGYILKPSDTIHYLRAIARWKNEPRISVYMPRRTPTPTPTAAPGQPTYTPQPPTATLPPSWTPSPTLTPTCTLTPTITATHSVTPTKTPSVFPSPPTPSMTPTPVCGSLGVTLWMPAHDFCPGSSCSCHVAICNPGPSIYESIPLFVILDVFGDYYFWPDFSAYAFEVIPTLDMQPLIYPVLQPFQWPEGAGSVTSGVRWLAAMTNPEQTAVMGEMDIWEFGWHP